MLVQRIEDAPGRAWHKMNEVKLSEYAPWSSALWGGFDRDAVSDRAMAAIAERCKELRTLVIRHCEKLSDGSVTTLVLKCRNLTTLDISWSAASVSYKAQLP